MGVVANPKSITSIPTFCKVALTIADIVAPDGLASLPITTELFGNCLDLTQLPNAAANFTTSNGVKASFGEPPIVPLIPDIDFINVIKIIII